MEIHEDCRLDGLKEANRNLLRKYRLALEELRKKDEEITAILGMQMSLKTASISEKFSTKGEATPVVLLSDWHVDEVVKSDSVNGLNEFSAEIAAQRVEMCFQNILKLYEINGRDVRISTAVVALLGDFISSNIHEELLENTSMLPVEAVIFAQNLLASGFEFLLKNTKYDFIVPCLVGNHSRITKERHISTEWGNSLEYFMYHSLAQKFAKEKRIKFLIPKGYFCYLDVYGFTCRFHHGHSVNYGGGVGGITIPLNKAIAQWNRARKVDYDFLGHFHQLFDGGNFSVNGSVIGYSPYGISVKAGFEKPRQSFLLIDKKQGKTVRAPIFLD